MSLAKGLGLWYHNREIEKKKQRGFVYGKIIFQIRRDGQLQIGTGTHYEIQLRGTGDARLADEALRQIRAMAQIRYILASGWSSLQM